MTIESKKRFITNTAFIAVVAVLFYFVLKYLAVWLLPFVIGFLCALVLQKPIAFLSKKTKIPRAIWSLVLVIAILSILLGGIFFLGYYLYDQANHLVKGLTDQLPTIQSTFGGLVHDLSGWLNNLNLPSGVTEAIAASPASLIEKAVGFLSDFVATLAKSAFVSVPSLILNTILSVVACCFITIDYYKITNFVLCQFPEETQKLLIKTKRVFMENIFKMLWGYTLILFITFLQLFFGFLIFGIDYAATIAVFVAILDILPVLGVGAVLIPWAIIDLCLGNTVDGIGLLILYLVVIVVRNIIEPKIIGNQVGLPAIVTLISMYLGLYLFGIAGLFVLPVIIIVIMKLQEAGMIHIWKTGNCVSPTIVKREEEQNKRKFKKKQKNCEPQE